MNMANGRFVCQEKFLFEWRKIPPLSSGRIEFQQKIRGKRLMIRSRSV
jgi:hypothetical protein